MCFQNCVRLHAQTNAITYLQQMACTFKNECPGARRMPYLLHMIPICHKLYYRIEVLPTYDSKFQLVPGSPHSKEPGCNHSTHDS